MKKYMYAIAAGCLMVVSCTPLRVKEPETIAVSDVISEVERTLAKVKEKSSIEWESVELTLETVVKEGASSSIEFWVVSSEASVTDSVTQTVYYKLKQKKVITPSMTLAPHISDRLSDAIVKADSDMKMAIDQSQRLESDGFSVSIKFAAEMSKTGGAKVELVPITVGAKATRAKTAAHTIKITYK